MTSPFSTPDSLRRLCGLWYTQFEAGEHAVYLELYQQQDTAKLVQRAVSHLRTLAQLIRFGDAQLHINDKVIRVGKFLPPEEHTPHAPFFTWTSERQPHKVLCLLLGEAVSLYADVLQSPKGRDAIKMLSAFVNVSASAKMDEWARRLGLYEVQLTHSGTSHYRWKDRYSQQSTGGFTVVAGNKAARKLAESDPMSSPYTHWTVTLKPILQQPLLNAADWVRQDRHWFQDNLRDTVLQLHLCGEGWYVDS